MRCESIHDPCASGTSKSMADDNVEPSIDSDSDVESDNSMNTSTSVYISHGEPLPNDQFHCKADSNLYWSLHNLAEHIVLKKINT